MIPLTTPDRTHQPAAARPALVLDVQGSWALLWFPDSGRSDWIDLSRVEFERVESPHRGSPDED